MGVRVRFAASAVACALLLTACDDAGRTPEPVAPSPAASSPSVLPADEEPGVALAARPLRRYVKVFRHPGAERPQFVLDAVTPLGKLAPMLVTRTRERRGRAWFQVLLPLRPNGARGWVRDGDVRPVRRRHRVEVDLSERVLRHYLDGELVERLRVGIGQSRYPTPKGTFYVWVKVRYPSPSGPYGALALGLSGFSRVIDWWPGGGRLAIHGTTNPGDRGRQVSHGCVRVFNAEVLDLWRLPLGTPVVIGA